jgi:hypothetical protein
MNFLLNYFRSAVITHKKYNDLFMSVEMTLDYQSNFSLS